MSRLNDWSLLPDPENRGVAEGWFRDVRQGAQPAQVPGTIQQVFPGYEGVAWYWTTISSMDEPPAQGRALLRFGAVDYRATVWVDGHLVGEHENGETPFDLDVTDGLARSGSSLVAVRVLGPTDHPIDGITLLEVPHRNKRGQGYHPGWLHNYAGIVLPVELEVVPSVRITDLHVRPDPSDGAIVVSVTVRNDEEAAASGRLSIITGPDHSGSAQDAEARAIEVPPGEGTWPFDLHIPDPRRWDLDDPFLYRATATLEASVSLASPTVHHRSARFGFRDFRITDGYFRLNGRRVFLRSSHTGNHFPVGQVVPPTPDLMRRDLINAKASGFNAVRFMSGVAWPEQLDFCDEIGLLVWQEPMAAWLLKNSPAMTERYDRSLREMLLRDRNHPSVAIWGLLTETPDGPVFRHALTRLAMVRDLDPTRLVILNSGRFDARPAIGSVSNPGGTVWEHTWGNEAPGATGRDLVPDPTTGWLTAAAWINGDLSLAGSIEGNGDTHVYPRVPHSREAIAWLRTLGRDTKPHMLSEYGIGSLMNVIGETRRYEQEGVRPDLLDAAAIRSMADRFQQDWLQYGMDGIYPFPEDMLLDAQRLHGRQRALGFDIVRSNPRFAGFNVTGLLDHALTGEGFWTFWRQWKPGIVDVLADGWAPLRWCLFGDPIHAYPGRDLRLEAVLANEDVLAPGAYPARFRLSGPEGIVWQESSHVVIPQPIGPDGPLAVAALDATITAPSRPGAYTFAAELRSGGRPAGGRLRIQVFDPAGLDLPGTRVVTWGIDDRAVTWLRGHQVTVDPIGAPAASGGSEIILVGEPVDGSSTLAAWQHLAQGVARGGIAVFLSPNALRRDDAPLGWLPLDHQARCEPFYDWVYHREWVGSRHPILADLPGPGIMDWELYGPVLSQEMFEGLPPCDDVAAAAFAVGYSTPGGYASGIVAGTYPLGAGRFALNTFHILPNIDRHPAADRLMVNLIRWASTKAAAAQEPPGDVDALLSRIGYR